MSADAAFPTGPVRAAGGVVWRRNGAGPVEILLVHRPRYGDWSLPKGKCDKGESDEDCALREVEEETGWRCRLGPELPSTRYRDNKDRSKVVRDHDWDRLTERTEAVLEQAAGKLAA